MMCAMRCRSPFAADRRLPLQRRCRTEERNAYLTDLLKAPMIMQMMAARKQTTATTMA